MSVSDGERVGMNTAVPVMHGAGRTLSLQGRRHMDNVRHSVRQAQALLGVALRKRPDLRRANTLSDVRTLAKAPILLPTAAAPVGFPHT